MYVDASHYYEPARLDIQRSKVHLAPNGLLIVHDYKRPGDRPDVGVNQAVPSLQDAVTSVDVDLLIDSIKYRFATAGWSVVAVVDYSGHRLISIEPMEKKIAREQKAKDKSIPPSSASGPVYKKQPGFLQRLFKCGD